MIGRLQHNRTVLIGSYPVGGEHPTVLQTMTNTPTSSIAQTIEQMERIYAAGGRVIRLAVPALTDVEPLRQIVSIIKEKKLPISIVADVHYIPQIAEEVALFVDKVRVNPGNFVPNAPDVSEEEYLELLYQKTTLLFARCKENGTAIRIGINHGSLDPRIIKKYGNGAEGLAQSAIEWAKVCQYHQYFNIIFSLKSSSVTTLLEANARLVSLMQEGHCSFPLHIGVTEAANEMEGRVKSSVGIGALLLNGIGNTIRISLTEAPENEIHFGKRFLEAINEIDPKEFSLNDGILTITSKEKDKEKWWSKVGAMAGYYFYQHQLKDIQITDSQFSREEEKELIETILQVLGLKITKTEIIACPSCGRTQYDIQSVLSIIKEKFSHFPGLTIGVMGCVVNGPGEMREADIGVVGSTNQKIAIYKKEERISPFLPTNEALAQLEIELNKIIREKQL